MGQQTIGRFEIRDFLGRGALGDVLLAWDGRDERLVALKVVRTGKCDPEMLEAEKSGVALQAQLAAVAPQVAAVYECGEDGDFFWMAMEYVDGDDLSQVLARGPLPEARAVAIAFQLVSMLEVCHEFSAEVNGRRILGIVHGDIKPENIRLQSRDGEERVRVLDFGIAKHLTQTRRFTVNLFGSLPYTPPERLERGVVDRHSDLWAAGVVLAAMVSGRRPFPGNTPEELEQAIRRGLPSLPLPTTCSPGLCWIVDRSLAFEVLRRYATAAELRADLAALRDGLPLPSMAAIAALSAELAKGSREAVVGSGDLHATRRTQRPLSPEEAAHSEATRRTERPAAFASGTGELAAMAAMAAMPATPAATAAPAMAATADSATTRATLPTPATAAGESTGRTVGGPFPLRTSAPIAASFATGVLGSATPATTRTPSRAGLAAADANPWDLLHPGAAASAAAEMPLAAVVADPGGRAGRLAWRLLWIVLVLAALAAGGAQLWAWNEAKSLRHELAEAHPDLVAIAHRYGEISSWSLFSPDLFGLGDELVKDLSANAERILDSYHGDDPTTTQRGWQTAYDLFHTAVQIAPRDRKLRARMLYSQAHLDRIQSIAVRTQGDRKKAADLSREAASGFQEASRWDPEWPDPYLGLARIYAYDLFDLEALQKTLGELGRRGYHIGRRETAMLADGFRMQGLGLVARAQHVRGTAAEGDLLRQAQNDLEQALRFYGDIAGFADSSSNRAETKEQLDVVDARLSQVRPPGFWQRLGKALVRELQKPTGQ
jgi:eukaryotic-like serine/threonine-protein kinase